MSKREEARIKAKVIYKIIMKTFEDIQKNNEYDIGFCWDECLWIDDEFFHDHEMQED